MNEKATPQEYWDSGLVFGWQQDSRMNWLVASYLNYIGANLEPEDVVTSFDGVPRGIRAEWEINRPIRAWVADNLPKISSMLWADAPYEQVMSVLRRTKRIKPRNTGVISEKDRRAQRAELKRINIARAKEPLGNRRTVWTEVK